MSKRVRCSSILESLLYILYTFELIGDTTLDLRNSNYSFKEILQSYKNIAIQSVETTNFWENIVRRLNWQQVFRAKQNHSARNMCLKVNIHKNTG